VYTSDAKVRVVETGLSTYPDASVVCGRPERAPDDRNALINPLVLVEVLSDGTEGWDRAGKFRRYRKLASLRHYVLVSQHERCIEVCSRDADGSWALREASDGESAMLDALGGALEVDRVYRNVTLTPGARASE
jgi:Uma2 family endonuclease